MGSPVFELLQHQGRDQLKKPLKVVFDGEEGKWRLGVMEAQEEKRRGRLIWTEGKAADVML